MNADRAPQLKAVVGHLLDCSGIKHDDCTLTNRFATILLYLFVVIAQIMFGIYSGSQVEPPPALTLVYAVALLWITGWWLRRDSRKHEVPWVYDMGFFLVVAWPFIMPYYLVKSRGAKGLFVILGFVGAYIGALIIGITISVLATASG